MNPLRQIHTFGQSIWLDNIRRSHIQSGALARLIQDDGIRGETSNPAIFEKAIAGSGDYDDAIQTLRAQRLSTPEIYETLAVQDVQMAADVFRPLYEATDGLDGFVSLEVSPHLAHDTTATIAEAERLWEHVNRPNAMIKIPATQAGLPAIETCLYRGLNINVTLLFSVQMYEQVARTYIRALERRYHAHLPIDHIASVASFFVSRIDTLGDKWLADKITTVADAEARRRLEALKGKVAIANAKMAYCAYQDLFGSGQFEVLRYHGARVQRPLWASTSAKNPAYRDVMYVETLIGPNTVNTLPQETIDAFRDHGRAASTLTQDIAEAEQTLANFAANGFSLDALTQQALAEGVQKFVEAFNKLLASIEQKAA